MTSNTSRNVSIGVPNTKSTEVALIAATVYVMDRTYNMNDEIDDYITKFDKVYKAFRATVGDDDDDSPVSFVG